MEGNEDNFPSEVSSWKIHELIFRVALISWPEERLN